MCAAWRNATGLLDTQLSSSSNHSFLTRKKWTNQLKNEFFSFAVCLLTYSFERLLAPSKKHSKKRLAERRETRDRFPIFSPFSTTFPSFRKKPEWKKRRFPKIHNLAQFSKTKQFLKIQQIPKTHIFISKIHANTKEAHRLFHVICYTFRKSKIPS